LIARVWISGAYAKTVECVISPAHGQASLSLAELLSWSPSSFRTFSFGNGNQAIEIAEACFDHFFQMRHEIIEQSNGF
jgi:hypothetical protein